MNLKVRSLRVRLLMIAAGIVVTALFATGLGLSELFERHAKRRVGQELDVYLNQLSGGLRFNNGDASITRLPSDPRFEKIFGGLYWQITDYDGHQILLRSRSLWDADLGLPDDALAPGEIHQHSVSTLFSRDLLVHEQRISIPQSSITHDLRISVAIDGKEIDALAAGFRADLVPALLMLGVVLMAGFGFQISAGLQPLNSLKDAVNGIRSGRQSRLDGQVPKEIEPLVEEVNSLLEMQDKNMIRARDRAADLAHGLKTPLTALTTDIDRLRRKGETEIAADIEDVALRMKRYMDRELAQARIRHGGNANRVPLGPTLDGIIRTLSRTPSGETIEFRLNAPDEVRVAMDPDDLNEVIGNLLENAARHTNSVVSVSVRPGAGRATVDIEDDGAGLSPEKIEMVMQRGSRLDVQGTGAGLGLAIVQDILEASDATMTMSESPLGGLLVRLDLPTARDMPQTGVNRV